MAAAVTVVSGVASFALVLAVVPAAAHHDLSYLRVDAVSAIFLLATGFLYGAVAVYAIGYSKGHHDRRFYAGLNLFASAMLAAPLMSSLALLATVFAYYAGAQVLGEYYNLAIHR